ncbi:hypothetical protein SAMN05660830_02361 [Halodesulfovibrio aestuarii]|uniref:Uncharacterized protein n=1 Tax=Halodesulfovibrio aestuarii TaxID=126333 RepID=A0A8G2CAU5_9BACT|nr:hypothetical protein SAMN05660830_02361 [Halodesulfovibrio aestuarii]
MLKRILVGWFGFILAYRGGYIALYGHYTWNPRSLADTKLMGIPICVVGLCMILYAVAPNLALKLKDKIFKRQE